MNDILIDKADDKEAIVTEDKTNIFAQKPAEETHTETPKAEPAENITPVAEPTAEEEGKTEPVKEEADGSETPKEKEAKKIQWQCKYRRYHMILPIYNKEGEVTKTGKRIMEVIRARNWRIPLNLEDPRDLAVHNALLASPQCGNEFMLLKDTKKDKGDLAERGLTLSKLMDMPDDQLMGMLNDEEMEEAGLIPGVHQDRMQLILAIIDAKKFSERGGDQ